MIANYTTRGSKCCETPAQHQAKQIVVRGISANLFDILSSISLVGAMFLMMAVGHNRHPGSVEFTVAKSWWGDTRVTSGIEPIHRITECSLGGLPKERDLRNGTNRTEAVPVLGWISHQQSSEHPGFVFVNGPEARTHRTWLIAARPHTRHVGSRDEVRQSGDTCDQNPGSQAC